MLALLEGLRTANQTQRERALTAAYTPAGIDPDAGHTARGDRHYREVSGSARDLPATTTREIQERALSMRFHNPLARRYVDLVRELCTQTEWTVQAEDEAVNEVLQDFWAGPYNQWPQWIGSYGDVLNTTGVLALPVWVNAMDGSVSCGYADPAELSDAAPTPGNPRRIMAVKWQPAGRVGDPYILTVANPITERTGRLAPYYGRLMAEDPRKRMRPTGALYFRSASLPNETVGISDLSAAIDPLANHETFMAASLEQAMLIGRFVGEVTLKGPSGPKEVAEVAARLKDEPMFASLAVHNEQEEHKYSAPSSGGYEAAARDRLHGNYAASSLGPGHVIRNDFGEGNRAVATSATDPMYLKAQSKLRALVGVSRYACQYAIDCAIITGKLPPSADDTFTITTPQILKKDLAAGADVILKITQFMAMAEQREWTGRATAQEVFVRMLPELGLDDITLEKVREDLETNGPAVQVYTPGVQDAVRRAVEPDEDETEVDG